MGISNDQSCYQNQPTSRTFSVTKTNKQAVAVAEQIYARLPADLHLLPETMGAFVAYLSIVTEYGYIRCNQMLGSLGPMGKNRYSALRIAYAIMGYLPCFDKSDHKLESPYQGSPVFPVHCRATAVAALRDPAGKPSGEMKFRALAMSSILAGRQYDIVVDWRVIHKLLRKIYCGRGNAGVVAPAEISGCYFTVDSNILSQGKADWRDVPRFIVNAEERRINKQLFKDRSTRCCTKAKSCALCNKGRDSCALAVRTREKRQGKENPDAEN